MDGVVLDGRTQAPVAGATVSHGGGQTLTDRVGRFSLEVPAGGVTVRVTADGYGPVAEAMTVPPGGVLDKVFVQLSEDFAGEVVEIQGDAPLAAPAPPGSQEITREQVDRIPGTHGDVLGSVSSMPGVAGVAANGPGAGRLVLRGAGSEDTRITIPGRLPGNAAVARAGPVPAGRGAPLAHRFHRPGLRARRRQPVVHYRAVLLRRSAAGRLGAGRAPPAVLLRAGQHRRGRADQRQHPAGRAGSARLDRRRQPLRAGAGDLGGRSAALHLPAHHGGQHRNFSLTLGDSFLRADEQALYLREDATMRLRDRVDLRIGGEASAEVSDTAIDAQLPPIEGQDPMSSEVTPPIVLDDRGTAYTAGAYAAMDLRPWAGTTITPGLRIDHHEYSDATTLGPRASVSQRLGRVTARAALGLYSRPLEQQELIDPSLEPERAVQSVLGAEARIPGGVTVSGTGFYTWRRDLAVYDPERAARDPERPYRSQGTGRSFGSELLARSLNGLPHRPLERAAVAAAVSSCALRSNTFAITLGPDTGLSGFNSTSLRCGLRGPHLATALAPG